MEGREAPPHPVFEPPAGDYGVFMAEEARLADAERRWLVANGPLLEEAVAQREAELLAEAGAVLRQLGPIASELGELVAVARTIRAAVSKARWQS